jgi:predicted protein tyrosine phosphatase
MKLKVLTVCSGGLVRSVGLADVLKIHFNCDVIPVGIDLNTPETVKMLLNWADIVVCMHEPFVKRIEHLGCMVPVLLCEVGPDNYHSAQHPSLIDQVWRWTRANLSPKYVKENV